MKLEPAISGSAKMPDESARLFQCLTVGERDLNQAEDISPATFFAAIMNEPALVLSSSS